MLFVVSTKQILPGLPLVLEEGYMHFSSLQNLELSFLCSSYLFNTNFAFACRIPELATLRRCLAIFQSSLLFVNLAFL